jgi:transcriptional regulator with XRE-family HTH domain
LLKPIQCRMARAALLLGVRDLAAKAGLSTMTVTRFENGHSPGSLATQNALKAVLESGGVEFIPENGGGAGVRLKKAAH